MLYPLISNLITAAHEIQLDLAAQRLRELFDEREAAVRTGEAASVYTTDSQTSHSRDDSSEGGPQQVRSQCQAPDALLTRLTAEC